MNAAPSTEPLANHHRRVFDYDRWATQRVVEALEAMPRPPAKAVERLAHIVAAQELWFSRVEKGAEPPESLRPTWSLRETAERAERAASRWSMFISSLADVRLHQPIRYTSTEGRAYESRLHEILCHIVTHGAYHRGQIACDIRAAGAEPPATDAILMTRRG